MRYLDAVSLAQLKNLRFELGRYRAQGRLPGRHRSAHRGFSQEFAHHREYAPGDDLRYMDWKVYARKDRYFVRQFQEDKSLQAHLLVDASGSMGYQGTGTVSKWEYACRLAAGMAYLVLVQGDAAGLVTFDVEPRTFLPPRRQISHLELIDSALAGARPGGETGFAGALRRALVRISRRSLIVLISDLLGDAGSVLEVVRALRARKHEVFVLQVLDPMERDLSLEGPVQFESLEGDGVLRCEVSAVRKAYRELFELQQRLYQGGFHQAAVPYLPAYTDVAWDRSLTGFLTLQASHRA